MSDQPVLTTAAALNDFCNELIESGCPVEQAYALAPIALQALVRGDGALIVRGDEVTA